MYKEFMIESIVNEDGTEFELPKIPEYLELIKKYPTCDHLGYSCMFCGKCMSGDNFKPANDTERSIINKQAEVTHNYMLDHNPSMRGRLKRYECR